MRLLLEAEQVARNLLPSCVRRNGQKADAVRLRRAITMGGKDRAQIVRIDERADGIPVDRRTSKSLEHIGGPRYRGRRRRACGGGALREARGKRPCLGRRARRHGILELGEASLKGNGQLAGGSITILWI